MGLSLPSPNTLLFGLPSAGGLFTSRGLSLDLPMPDSASSLGHGALDWPTSARWAQHRQFSGIWAAAPSKAVCNTKLSIKVEDGRAVAVSPLAIIVGYHQQVSSACCRQH